MLYLVMGHFRPGAQAELPELDDQFNEHLAQPFRSVRAVAALHDRDGQATGFLALLEASRFEEAESYLRESPYFQAGLYARVEVAECRVEAGALVADSRD